MRTWWWEELQLRYLEGRPCFPSTGGTSLSVPLSLSHSYMCCHVKKRNCRLLEKFEKLMYRIVGTWCHEKSGRESRNLKAGDTVDAIIK